MVGWIGLLSFGCGDEPPPGGTTTVTTGGGGGHTTSIAVATSVGVGGAPPTCFTCADAIQGSGGPLCAQSAQLFGALITCACQINCPMQCFNACNGGMGDPTCDQCIYNACWPELEACFNDF